MEKEIKIAAKLYECRDTAKRFYGDQFEEQIKSWTELILKVKKANNIDVMQSSIKIAQLKSMEQNGIGTMLLFAATVEILEPSKS